MVAAKQPTRAYDSSGRRARAAETRRQIVGAAHELFVSKGYRAITVAAVAQAARVSEPTVYAGFGSKALLLRSAIEIALAGDDEPVAVADRPLARWVYDADTATELLSRYAVMMGELAERAGQIYMTLVRAADGEPELSVLLADLENQRLMASKRLAEAVRDRGSLPAQTTLDEARDTIWVCNAPELYVALTTSRGWSTMQYVSWARNALIRLVTEPATR